MKTDLARYFYGLLDSWLSEWKLVCKRIDDFQVPFRGRYKPSILLFS